MSATQCPAIDRARPAAPAPVYDPAYFIAKFERIPEHRFCVGAFRRAWGACILGHCGADYGRIPTTGAFGVVHTAESLALVALFGSSAAVSHLNDGMHPQFQQPTPKQRILAALRAL